MYILDWIMVPIQIIIFLFTVYYFLIGVNGLWRKKEKKILTPQKTFAVIVAAHNESAVIGQLVDNLKMLDYPKELYDIFVEDYFNMRETVKENIIEITKKDLLKLNIINANSEVDRMVALNQYQIEYVQPLEIKAEYSDKVLSSDGTLTVKEIAQDFGKTANWLNKILNTLGIQYKQGSKWHLYAKYKDLGLVKEITVYDEENDRNFTRMKWTQKGREFIHNLLKENEIIG